MKTILVYFYVIIMFQNHVFPQSTIKGTSQESTIKGLFTNNKKELVYFYHDSILFRIYNNDAFGTFTIGKGKCHNNGGKICTYKPITN